MKNIFLSRMALVVGVAISLLGAATQTSKAQNVTDEIEVIRGNLKADRKVVVAESMQLTDAESAAFWPLYRNYRAEMDTLGDGLVKLILEYADSYPNLAEDRAAPLLNEYLVLEKKWAAARSKHLKRISKVLPASKALRFAQVENRLDLAVRLQMASAIPLVPTRKSSP